MAIDIKNVSKSFVTKDKDFTALKNVNLHVDDGELICLLGPSGCGKTTLLRMIGGLEKADEGEIFDRGELVTGPSKDRGFIFQQYSLFPWLNVLDNVMFGLNLNKDSSKGLGYMILTASQLFQPGTVVVGMIVIGIIGILFDYGFRKAQEKIFW